MSGTGYANGSVLLRGRQTTIMNRSEYVSEEALATVGWEMSKRAIKPFTAASPRVSDSKTARRLGSATEAQSGGAPQLPRRISWASKRRRSRTGASRSIASNSTSTAAIAIASTGCSRTSMPGSTMEVQE